MSINKEVVRDFLTLCLFFHFNLYYALFLTANKQYLRSSLFESHFFMTTGNGVQIDNHMFMHTKKKKLSSTLTHFKRIVKKMNCGTDKQTDRYTTNIYVKKTFDLSHKFSSMLSTRWTINEFL